MLSSRMSKRNLWIDRGGSILLEALLAVSIISISLVLIIQAYGTTLKASFLTVDYSRAILLAENYFAQMLFMKEVVEPKSADEQEFFEGFALTVEENKPDINPVGELNQVMLHLTWKTGQKTRDLSFETFFLKDKK